MNPTDKRGYLETEPFSYRQGKDGKVVLFWEGKGVKTLKGRAAERFLSDVSDAGSSEAQLMMAKLTGNFKRGNERQKNPFKKGQL